MYNIAMPASPPPPQYKVPYHLWESHPVATLSEKTMHIPLCIAKHVLWACHTYCLMMKSFHDYVLPKHSLFLGVHVNSH